MEKKRREGERERKRQGIRFFDLHFVSGFLLIFLLFDVLTFPPPLLQFVTSQLNRFISVIDFVICFKEETSRLELFFSKLNSEFIKKKNVNSVFETVLMKQQNSGKPKKEVVDDGPT